MVNINKMTSERGNLMSTLNDSLEVNEHNPKLELLETSLEAKSVNFYYGKSHAIKNVSLLIPKKRVTAFIGPSGCGKSTLLRCFNRMNDLIDSAKLDGQILFQGQDINSASVNVTELRRKIGMVFQKSNPFPKSIYENVAFGLRIHGVKKKAILDEAVERSLKSVALWNEVADRLDSSALALSGGQQQRLCIARAIATEPEVLLMDEPCSALDPIATAKVEELVHSLKEQFTIVIVTHNMQQATRVSDFTAFMFQGELVEFNATEQLFQKPREQKTDDYIRGKFG
jgi:phosphate transport system ATP-binding protein